MKFEKGLKGINKIIEFAKRKTTLRGFVSIGWKAILGVFSVATLVIVIGTFYIIFQINNEEFSSGSSVSPKDFTPADIKSIQSIVEYVELKETMYDELTKNSPQTFDPSL